MSEVCLRCIGWFLTILGMLVSLPLAMAYDETADEMFWKSVSECRIAAQVELYLTEFPSGRYVEEARACLEKISKSDLVKLLGRSLMAEAKDLETGWTDLHYAAAADLPAEIAALVGAGVPVDARLASGHVGLGQRLQEVLSGLGHGEAFQSWWANAETALMIAVYVGATDSAAALVELGADIDAKNDYGDTPLHFAAWGDSVSVLEWLVELGVDIGARDDHGDTPLHFAAWADSVSALEWLVLGGADIDAKNNIDATPLHFAALADSVSALEWLVLGGADIDAKNNIGATPLHYAASANSVSALEWLVVRGADIDAKGVFGKTPLDIAGDYGADDAEVLLRSLGAN